MLLHDRQLRQFAPHPECVNPTSIDFAIGDSLIVEREANGFPKIDLRDYTANRPYELQPGEFVLASTANRLTLPPTVGATIALKSTRARQGYGHPPTWIDPGFDGVITLEISNRLRYHPLPLYPGMMFGQYVCWRCDRPDRTYADTGRYQGATGVEQAKN